MSEGTARDWTRPDKDGFHLLRERTGGKLYIGLFRRLSSRTEEWSILSPYSGHANLETPQAVARYFDYIAPIEEPAHDQ